MFNLKVEGNYIYNNDKPIFILGDTAWLLLHKLDLCEIKRYFKNRKSIGFNYIQFILVHDLSDEKVKYDNDFWIKAKQTIEMALKYDLIVGLLPFWGSNIKNGKINKSNINDYAYFLSDYFKDYSNIIWVLGGDIKGDRDFETFNILGNILHENTNNLITFHPFGRTGSYLWFNDCNWLSFNMFQSGHRRYDQLDVKYKDDNDEASFGEDCYKYVLKAKTYNNVKPILDGEPSYEGIVQGLHDDKEPYWEARHIRRYAYWSVFAGACGFIYGNNAIIQFYNYETKGIYGVRESWYEALSSPGSVQLRYLKELIESFDYINGISNNSLIMNNKIDHHKSLAFAGDDYILIYSYKGDKLKIDLSKYKKLKLDLFIMNPENNSLVYYDTIYNKDIYEFRPTKRRELSNDWVLIFKKSV